MAYEIETENVKDYYANLLILQYRNKPKASATIKLGAGIYLADGLIFELNDILNLETQQGAQLDLIGQILGVNRNLVGFTDNSDYFTFEKTNALGYSDKYQLSKGYWKNYSNSTASIYSLNDDDYKTLLKFKALYNQMKGSMGEMDNVLYKSFGDDLYITNNKDLSITYNIVRNTTAIKAAKYRGLLKAPMGIKVLFDDDVWAQIIPQNKGWGIACSYEFFITDTHNISKSNDGKKFNIIYTSDDRNYFSIVCKDTTVIALGNILNGSLGIGSAIIKSDDLGQNWETVLTDAEITGLNCINYLNNLFIVVGDKYILTSSDDGENWTNTQLLINSGITNWRDVAYNNNTYVMLGNRQSGSGSSYVTTSTNGTTWTTPTLILSSHYCSSIAFGNGVYVAVGQEGYLGHSADIENWTWTQSDSSIIWNKVRYHHNKFYAVGNNGYVITSSNGINWDNPMQIGNSDWHDIAADDEKVIIVGDGGTVLKYFN